MNNENERKNRQLDILKRMVVIVLIILSTLEQFAAYQVEKEFPCTKRERDKARNLGLGQNSCSGQ